MSLLTQAAILDKYGMLLGVKELAAVTGLHEGTVRNQISAQTFPIPTSLQLGRRVAHYEDVAKCHLSGARRYRGAAQGRP